MHRGYIKLWRKSLDTGLMSNAEAWRLWTYLLMKATHKAHTQLVGSQLVTLEPGQLVTGRQALANALHTTERKIRTSLALLVKCGNVTIKPTSKYSIISVCNWQTYQASDQQGDQQPVTPATSKRPANDQQMTTNKNSKNSKHKKNVEELEGFDSFWAEYPRKVSKANARKAWAKRKCDEKLDAILIALSEQKQHESWTKDGGKFVPHPATWLNGERWEDELDAQATSEPDHTQSTPKQLTPEEQAKQAEYQKKAEAQARRYMAGM